MSVATKSINKGTAMRSSSKRTPNRRVRVQSALRTISILLAVSESPNGLKVKENN